MAPKTLTGRSTEQGPWLGTGRKLEYLPYLQLPIAGAYFNKTQKPLPVTALNEERAEITDNRFQLTFLAAFFLSVWQMNLFDLGRITV